MASEGGEGRCVPHRPDWERKEENGKKEEAIEETNKGRAGEWADYRSW